MPISFLFEKFKRPSNVAFFRAGAIIRRPATIATMNLSTESDIGSSYKVVEDSFLKNCLNQITHKKTIVQESLANNSCLSTAIHSKLRYEWTYNSNAIEGNTLSLGDTIFFLKEGLTVQGKPLGDFLEAKNHDDAIEGIFSIITKQTTITSSDIRNIHKILMSGTTHTVATDQFGNKFNKPMPIGEYKRDPNHVLLSNGDIHYHVEPFDVARQMLSLCDYINNSLLPTSNINPIIASAIAHYNMVRIHPFDDGNGRCSRLLMNLMLLKNKYPIIVILQENRSEYLDTLNKADKGDLLPFAKFIATSALRTLNVMTSEIERYESLKKDSNGSGKTPPSPALTHSH